jgi:signal transduction histidine kinase
MLRDFVRTNRDQILAEARLRVAKRSGPAEPDADRTRGLPIFLDQLGEALRKATAHEVLDHTEIQNSAHRHGNDLFDHGLTVDQVVHDYGDLCQVITGLAVDQGVSVAVEEFQTLNLCLDDAIAGAVTAYSQQRERKISDEGTERLGVLAHEMRNVLNTAIIAFGPIRKGLVAPAGTTGAALERSLIRLNVLIDRSLADVRLEAGMQNMEHVPVREILDEVEIGAGLVAQTRGVQFEVQKVDRTVIVEADRQILAAAVANLLLNAFKFTRPNSTVKLRAHATASRVLIDVEDACGGLPPDAQESILQPFVQKGPDRTGLGLGLSICRKAAKMMKGELLIRDIPGEGCVFTIDLPKQPLPPLHLVPAGTDEDGKVASASKTGKAV